MRDGNEISLFDKRACWLTSECHVMGGEQSVFDCRLTSFCVECWIAECLSGLVCWFVEIHVETGVGERAIDGADAPKDSRDSQMHFQYGPLASEKRKERTLRVLLCLNL
jgi:hypothetical protein